MSNRPALDKLLRSQSSPPGFPELPDDLQCYASHMAALENVVVVISDIKANKSHIYSGRFGSLLGIGEYRHENSIWENSILNMMSDDEQEEKYLAELRFFHFLRRLGRHRRKDFYLVSKLRIKTVAGDVINILHRMFYLYSTDSDYVCYALCTYGSLPFDFVGKSYVVNSITGVSEELTPEKDISILTKRQQQTLKLIDSGKTSAAIAETLGISKNTVSRHRQEILAKLKAKNSIEACKIAKAIKII